MPEPFFLYHEDVDLSLRLRLRGGTARGRAGGARRPRLRVRQGRGEVALPRAQPLGDADPRLPGARCWRCSTPALLATELALLLASAAGGWLPQKLRAYGETLALIASSVRRATRDPGDADDQRRRVRDAGWSPSLDSAYLGAAGRSRLLAAVLGAYWRVVLRLLGARA